VYRAIQIFFRIFILIQDSASRTLIAGVGLDSFVIKVSSGLKFQTSYGLSIAVDNFNIFYVSFLSEFPEKWARPNWDQQLTPKIFRPVRMAHIRQSLCPRW
jgi:hypothetical protein